MKKIHVKPEHDAPEMEDRKAYQTPELKALGNVREVTKGVGGLAPDNMGVSA